MLPDVHMEMLSSSDDMDDDEAPSPARVPSRNSALPTNQRISVTDVIEQAISQGVPAFNSGDVGRCAQIYTNTAQRLIEHPNIDQPSKSALLASLQQTQQSRDANHN